MMHMRRWEAGRIECLSPSLTFEPTPPHPPPPTHPTLIAQPAHAPYLGARPILYAISCSSRSARMQPCAPRAL